MTIKAIGVKSRPFLIRTAVVFLALSLGYYVFFARPDAAANQQAALLTRHQATLLADQLAWDELSNLTPGTRDFINNRPGLISELAGQGEKIKALESDLKAAAGDTSILSETYDLLKRQRSLIKPLQQFDETVANIHAYSPEKDLADADTLAERAAAAAGGLQRIADDLKQIEHREADIYIMLEQAQATFARLAKEAGQNSPAAAATRAEAIKQFNRLKLRVWSAELSIMGSEAAKELVRQRSELLKQYAAELR